MRIKQNVLFFPDIEKTKNDSKLRMRIRWNANTLNFNVGYRIYPEKWNKETQRCKRNTTNAKQISASVINSKIQSMQDKADDVFKHFELNNKIPSKDEFRIFFNQLRGKTTNVNISHSFFNIFDKFVLETGKYNNWKKATFTKFNTVKNHLISYNNKLKYNDLDTEGLSNLVYFLREGKNYRDSTIKKYLSFLKWFLRWSYKKGYTDNNEFENFKPKLNTTKNTIVYLYWEELLDLYNMKIPKNKPSFERVRDIFCFSCFTSLRYSDVINLKKSDVYDDYIEITTIKTSDKLRIEFNNYSRAIIKKYMDNENPNNKVFPSLSNQKMNKHLKDLAKECNLNREITNTYYKGHKRIDDVKPLYELISTHAGRRTFISNAIIKGIPPQTVMKWTGHSDYSAMKPYIEIANKDKAKAMELFNN